jgi:outer membrane receptor protein involved in Fe transport
VGSPVTCDRSGNDPAFAPHHIANAWVSKKWEEGFGIGGGGRYVSRQYIAEDNSFSLDSYLVADGTVFYERSRYRVFLNLRNLTDEEYNVRAFPSNAVLPAPGLTVFAGVRFRN